jgi:hypothetical protein
MAFSRRDSMLPVSWNCLNWLPLRAPRLYFGMLVSGALTWLCADTRWRAGRVCQQGRIAMMPLLFDYAQTSYPCEPWCRPWTCPIEIFSFSLLSHWSDASTSGFGAQQFRGRSSFRPSNDECSQTPTSLILSFRKKIPDCILQRLSHY